MGDLEVAFFIGVFVVSPWSIESIQCKESFRGHSEASRLQLAGSRGEPKPNSHDDLAADPTVPVDSDN